MKRQMNVVLAITDDILHGNLGCTGSHTSEQNRMPNKFLHGTWLHADRENERSAYNEIRK